MADKWIEKCKISLLKKWDKNPRDNSKAVPVIEDSIDRFGFVNPIIINTKYQIVCGHGRIEAALNQGLKHVPVRMLSRFDDEKLFIAYNLVDNQTQTYSRFIDEQVAEQITILEKMDYDIKKGLAFTGSELKRIMKQLDTEDPGLSIPDTQYQVIVDCKDDKQQALLLDRLEKEGYECRALML